VVEADLSANHTVRDAVKNNVEVRGAWRGHGPHHGVKASAKDTCGRPRLRAAHPPVGAGAETSSVENAVTAAANSRARLGPGMNEPPLLAVQ